MQKTFNISLWIWNPMQQIRHTFKQHAGHNIFLSIHIYAYRERINANSCLWKHTCWYRYGSFILTSKGEFASNLEAEDQINLPTQQAGKHIHPDKHKTIHTPFYNFQKVWMGWHPTRNSKPNRLVTTSKDASAYQGLNIVTLQGQHNLHHMTHCYDLTMHINLQKPQPWKPRAWYGCPEQIALCCICVGYGLTMQIKMLLIEHDVDVLNRLHLCGLLACLSCAWEHDTSTRNHNVENSIVWVSWIDCIAGFVPRALKMEEP